MKRNKKALTPCAVYVINGRNVVRTSEKEGADGSITTKDSGSSSCLLLVVAIFGVAFRRGAVYHFYGPTLEHCVYIKCKRRQTHCYCYT